MEEKNKTNKLRNAKLLTDTFFILVCEGDSDPLHHQKGENNTSVFI